MSYSSIWSDLAQTSFEQGFVDARGIRTRYLHSGRRGAPGLIFLHGTGGHAEAYCRNLAAHGAYFDTYAIDMLGHGYTDKPDYDYELDRYHAHLTAFMDAVGLERASFSGESLGGWVAASFAVRNPGRVDKLVLNTAAADKIDPKSLEALRASTIAAVEDPNPDKIRARLQWLMRRPEQVTDDLVACRQAIYSQASMKAAVHRLLCLHTVEARRKYALSDRDWASLRCPTLVLWTSHDPTAKVEVGRELAGKIEGARFEVMQECGHWPQYEDAPTFNELHIGFLRAA
jgi:2-hydroxy-6-oxonona-2,4-dienedioate hydrolase